MADAHAERDAAALERRRRQAAKLLRQGILEAEVARCLGVSRQSVNRWAKALKARGLEGLRSTPRRGRPAGLDELQLEELSRLIKCGARMFGFKSDTWTGQRFGILVERRFGIAYSRTRAVILLRKVQRSLGPPR